jgi:uncharacterized protein (UPF0254 family)
LEWLLAIEMQLTDLEFSDLLDLADALAVPVISSIAESSYEGIFSLLGIDLPEGSSWCFQDVDVESDSERMQAQAFEQCEQTATDLVSKKILVSMLISEDDVKSLLDSYSCLRHW